MGFTEINSSGKRGEFLGRIDRQNSRFRTAKTTRTKFGLHDSFVELKSSKSALNEVITMEGDRVKAFSSQTSDDFFCSNDKPTIITMAKIFTPQMISRNNKNEDNSALIRKLKQVKHDLKFCGYLQCIISEVFKEVISRRKQRPAFDQVSEFDRGRIVAYRDCGLSFREIGSRVGRKQTTIMRICDRWMQEGTTDRRGRSHPPQCTTSREDRQIMCMAVTDRSVASRAIVQHIESVTNHSVSARTIRRRLQQSGLSARRPLFGLPLTQNHRRLLH
ncbi:transposable element Tcb1 transposase [Trichonephila clavipes]|nr:transposable element Tcb1 transposase [Trichonephila clavipes]